MFMISQIDPNKYIQSLDSWDRTGSERTRFVRETLTESKNRILKSRIGEDSRNSESLLQCRWRSRDES